MNSASSNQPEIWRAHSEIWPDFAKSAVLPKSEIWVFPFECNGLCISVQISEGCSRNLVRNLDFVSKFNNLRQISEFGKGTPKGVGGLPPSGGEVHHPPPGDLAACNFIHHPIGQHTGKEPSMAQASLTPSPAIAPADGTPVLLALDLGTTTGWALRAADGLITSGTVSLKPSRYDGGGMRYVRFRAWLERLATDARPIGAIHFEEVRRHVGTDAAHVFGGLLATLTAWAETAGVPYQGVPVGTIKRHATGKGNANKAAMIAAAQARGFSPADDNEADAIAILLWAIETEGGVQ